MHNIWKDVSQKLGLDGSLFKQRNYCVYGEQLVLIEGHKSVSTVTDVAVSFVYGGKLLTVYGQQLKIKSMSKGFVAVEGKIDRVECV